MGPAAHDRRSRKERATGVPAGQSPRDHRGDQADEADRAAHRDTGADSDGGEKNHLLPKPVGQHAHRGGDIFAEREAVEGISMSSKKRGGEQRREQRGGRLAEAAIDQASHQPVECFVECEG